MVDEHSLHAPFIFDFQTNVIKKKYRSKRLPLVLNLKRSLTGNQTYITITDFGTGKNKPQKRTISELAKTSNQPSISRLLYNIASRYNPKTILELGTNLGIGTLHLWAAVPESRIITLEGCPEISRKAKDNFLKLHADKIELITGPIEETLSPLLTKVDSIDLLFIDANHQYQATTDYFLKCLPKLYSQSIVIFDDIHWSREMERAWKQIIAHEKVTLSIDLFRAGVAFLNPVLTKSNYLLGL